MKAFSSIDISLSDICNLRCSFCYVHGGNCRQFNQETVDNTFIWIFKQFEDNATPEQYKIGLHINIYGGEPLIEWKHLIQIIPQQKLIAEQKKIPIKFTIVTNVTLLDNDKLEWLIKNNVSFSLSIDGCAAAQDLERKFADGSGSSDIVFKNARNIIKQTEKYRTVRMTVSPASVKYLYESVHFMVKDIGFRNINAVPAGGVEWTDDTLLLYKEQLKKITDFWIDEMRRGRYFMVWHLRKVFEGMQKIKYKISLCGSCKGLVGIDTKGDIFPCHRFCNPNTPLDYKLGDIKEGITNNKLIEQVVNIDILKINKEKCSNCPAILSCKNMCMHEMLIEHNNIFMPTRHHCILMKYYWEEGLRAHTIMMAENNRIYREKFLSSQQRKKPNKK